MRTRRSIGLLVGVLLGAFLTAGCAGSGAEPAPTPSSSAPTVPSPSPGGASLEGMRIEVHEAPG